MDRLLCMIAGHTWEWTPARGTKQCVHCLMRLDMLDLVSLRRRRSHWLFGWEGAQNEWPQMRALEAGWPKRAFFYRPTRRR